MKKRIIAAIMACLVAVSLLAGCGGGSSSSSGSADAGQDTQEADAGGAEQPDMYCAEAAFVLKYTQGDMSSYAMPYKDLGIDIDKAIADAQCGYGGHYFRQSKYRRAELSPGRPGHQDSCFVCRWRHRAYRGSSLYFHRTCDAPVFQRPLRDRIRRFVPEDKCILPAV